jgi:hypothetical protein
MAEWLTCRLNGDDD